MKQFIGRGVVSRKPSVKSAPIVSPVLIDPNIGERIRQDYIKKGIINPVPAK